MFAGILLYEPSLGSFAGLSLSPEKDHFLPFPGYRCDFENAPRKLCLLCMIFDKWNNDDMALYVVENEIISGDVVFYS